jgi:hypothetical protein
VFEVGGGFAVRGDNGPVVLGDHLLHAHVDHGFDGEDHAIHNLLVVALAAVVGNLGRLVHVAAEPVADKFADDAVAVVLGVGLDGVGDVADGVAGDGLLHPQVEAFAGDAEQFIDFGFDLADGKGEGMVAVEAVLQGAAIDGNDVAFLERFVVGDAVDDGVVDGDAEGVGEIVKPEKAGFCALAAVTPGSMTSARTPRVRETIWALSRMSSISSRDFRKMGRSSSSSSSSSRSRSGSDSGWIS